MNSVDFFIIVSGVYKNAAKAFNQVVKDADESTCSITGKSNWVVIKVPE